MRKYYVPLSFLSPVTMYKYLFKMTMVHVSIVKCCKQNPFPLTAYLTISYQTPYLHFINVSDDVQLSMVRSYK